MAFGGCVPIMIRLAKSGEFVLFQLDGSELHFGGSPYIVDEKGSGSFHLSQEVDPAGRSVFVKFGEPNKLLTL